MFTKDGDEYLDGLSELHTVTIGDVLDPSLGAAMNTSSARRDEVDLAHARLWIRRLKRGLDVEHPIAGDELRAIKR